MNFLLLSQANNNNDYVNNAFKLRLSVLDQSTSDVKFCNKKALN